MSGYILAGIAPHLAERAQALDGQPAVEAVDAEDVEAVHEHRLVAHVHDVAQA